ncbi:hypothetical protein NMY22_g3220 [Coprinellus aureogranulatus]|nr:hypothetical protein NMY22_g3220 [Coprinellus aureogranulatus]
MSPTSNGGGFETSTGTLYVSKPYRSKSSKKLRALVTFTPRDSAFDRGNQQSTTNEFRGFFTLFWISIFIFTVQTYVRSFEADGMPLNLDFAAMFSRDAITLAWSDALLVLSTGICVPIAIALKNNWIQYYWTGLIIQHVLQTTILFSAIKWTFNRQWPWVQSGFLTLHSFVCPVSYLTAAFEPNRVCQVLIMKMHSYLTVNGHMQATRERAESVLADLKELVSKLYPGTSFDDAIQMAQAARLEKEKREEMAAMLMSQSDSSGTSTPREGTPLPVDGGNPNSISSYVDIGTAAALRRRLNGVSETTSSNGLSVPPQQVHSAGSQAVDAPLPAGNGVVKTSAGSSSQPPAPDFIALSAPPPPKHPLVNHPNQEIATLAEYYSEVLADLRSNGPRDYTQWPDNITWKNFADYMLIPSLVYELEYPRTTRIRPVYVFEKTVATFGTFALLYTVTDRFILPYTPTPEQSFFRSLLDLALPFMIAYILLFYIIRLNASVTASLKFLGLGESTPSIRLHELKCSSVQWNSTSWDEFSRKWNKPVHTFLLRHVYAATILSSYRLSRTAAMLVTFALSAAAHELVMVIVTRKIRMYLFMMQIIQIPMILIGRLPAVKRNKTLGNIVFWLGLYAGFPLLCVAYVAH